MPRNSRIGMMFPLAVALVTLGGCDSKGVTRPPPTAIRVVNTAAHYPNITFRREESIEFTLEYGEGGAVSFDSGPYTLNFDTSLPNGSSVRVGTLSTTLAAGQLHTLVIAESATGIAPFIAESTPFSSTTEAEVIVIHAAQGRGTFDVYFEPSGTDLASATSLGNLAFGEDAPPATRTPENYRLYLTAPGDPSDVVFESGTVPAFAGESSALVLMDDGGVGIDQIVVARLSQTSAVVAAAAAPSALRVINGLSDRTDRDVLLNGQLLFPAAPYGAPTDYVTTDSGTTTLAVTPVNNPGAEELSDDITLPLGRLATTLIAGDVTNDIAHVTVTEDRRSLRTQATVRIMNAAALLNPVDVFIAPPGTDISQRVPLLSITAPGVSPLQDVQAGTYDLTLRDFVTLAIVYGPEEVTMNDGGVYGILILDAVGGSTADVVLIDDFE